MLANDAIQVSISSAQVSGAVGTLILLLLAVVGWLVKSEWRSVNIRLGEIEKNTAILPGLQGRVETAERRLEVLGRRSHKVINILTVLMAKGEMGQIDWTKVDKED